MRPPRRWRRAAAVLILVLPGPGWAQAEPAAVVAACDAGSAIAAGGSHIALRARDADFAIPRVRICEWVSRATRAVGTYYGRFPVAALSILLRPVSSARLDGATTYGRPDGIGHPLIVVRLGSSAAPTVLDDDWVMTHEMVHLSIPSVPRPSHWLEEGLATYVEPIARVQAGELTPLRIWSDMFRDMRKGLPQPGDQGLDHTATWGRTYWGGALFCLMADVEIRRRTRNRRGLQDALRGILAAGGSIEHDWTTERVMQVADSATGVPVMSALYARWRAAPQPDATELARLWRELGVSADGAQVRLSADAPLAAIRERITAPPG